jgi:hypothetical protein
LNEEQLVLIDWISTSSLSSLEPTFGAILRTGRSFCHDRASI